MALLVLNELGTIAGWLHPPAGYVPNFLPRNTDNGQYVTWLHALKDAFFIPDYHAPWLTEPALFNPALWVAAQVAQQLHTNPVLVYQGMRVLFYIFTAYSLAFAVRTFTSGQRQALAALLAAFLAVPVQSLLAAPALVFTAAAGRPPLLPGIGDFVWWSSDGFFHGISGSALVTFATGNTLLTLSLLALYLRTGAARWLAASCVLAAVGAFLHPFEICAIAVAGGLALLRVRRRKGILPAGLLGASALLGLLPYLLAALRHPWLRHAAELNHWAPYLPPRLLLMLGLPIIAGGVLWLLGARVRSPTDVLLACWVGTVLVELYIPILPHSQHLLDGFHYAGAMLTIRLAGSSAVVARLLAQRPRQLRFGLAGLLLATALTYAVFWRQGYLDGARPDPRRLFSTVVTRDEVQTLDWLRRHASPDDLVLAPPRAAPWFATPPMHSFASHQVFSLEHEEQLAQSEDFFGGRMDAAAAAALISAYGIRYVVVPAGGPAAASLRGAQPRARFGKLVLMENPGEQMRRYPAYAGPDPALRR